MPGSVLSILNIQACQLDSTKGRRVSPSTVPDVVVHLVGRLTYAVFGFLGPATDALAASGARQVLVVIDDRMAREVLPRLNCTVEVLLAADDRNPVRRWAHLVRLVRAVIKHRPLAALHLHGFLPGIIGKLLVRRTGGIKAPLYFSPHSSRTLLGSMRYVGALLLQLERPLSGSSNQVSIANVSTDARRLTQITGEAVEIVESPVPDEFFDVARHESRRPLLIGSGVGNTDESAKLFSQLAVLLGGSGLNLGFNWIGSIGPMARQCLVASNVGFFEPGLSANRASRMAAGWVYVAVDSARGFPISLAEAMSAGVPCVAISTANHRDLIRDGITGFLCENQHEMLQRIAELIDSADLRASIGRAARAESFGRFSSIAFSRNLIAAYERGEYSSPMSLDPLRHM